MTAHWGMPDPAAKIGTEAEMRFAFADTMRMLTNRINIFVSLPMKSLDALTLQKQLDAIGKNEGQRVPISRKTPNEARRSVSLPQRLVAETLGTAFLLAAVVGSGIMAQRLSGGNGALALLCNTLPTGAILTVLILTFGPLSGAHFNPAVSIAFALRRELTWPDAALLVVAQIIGGIIGVWAAHLMFELPLWQVSLHARTGRRAMARGIHRDLRAVAHDPRLSRAHTRGRSLRGRASTSPPPIGSPPRLRSPIPP